MAKEKRFEEWLTPVEAARWMERSRHTIYTWINRTRREQTETPLRLKRAIRKRDGKAGSGWLIEAGSLAEMDAGSPRLRTVQTMVVMKDGQQVASKNTYQSVVSDRRRWVEGFVAEGKKLTTVLAVFNPQLHDEIRGYYQSALEKQAED